MPADSLQVSETPRRPSGASWFERFAVAAMLVAFSAGALDQARHTSATFDEVPHLAAGYTYHRWNDFRLNPEHPPLLKLLAALPLLAMDVRPSADDLAARGDGLETARPALAYLRRAFDAGLRDTNWQWIFGHALLYGAGDGALLAEGIDDPRLLSTDRVHDAGQFLNDAPRLLFAARAALLSLGLLTGCLVYAWARELYGASGGLLALALFCFDPGFLGHSALVTTDVGLTAFVTGTIWSLWRLCHRLDAVRAATFLLFFALTFSVKFSAFLLIPMVALAGAGHVLSPEPWSVGGRGKRRIEGRAAKATVFAGLCLAAGVAACLQIWLSYGLRFSAAADPLQAAVLERALPAEPAGVLREPGRLPLEQVLREAAGTRAMVVAARHRELDEQEQDRILHGTPIGTMGKLILFAAEHRLLPEAWLYGFAFVDRKSILRDTFLLGVRSQTGFPAYFPVAFAFKTPLLAIFLLLGGVLAAARRAEPWSSRLAFLLVPPGLYLFASIAASLSIGHRHLLPVYPFLQVIAGGLALEWARWDNAIQRRILACATIAGLALSSRFVASPPWNPQRVGPDYLAYFNELAGGPSGGWRSLVDSNLDWGQDLPALREWLEEERIEEPIHLCWFGTADPRFYGVAHVPMPGCYGFGPPAGAPEDPASYASAKPGELLVISATLLQGLYLSAQARARWSELLEGATLVDRVGPSLFVFRLGG
jgi:4-amino-4-deoxy-L-arabinose transferase-like glycosyltransferase